MKANKQYLRKLINEELYARRLLEQDEEDPFAEEGGDEGGDDPFAEEGGEEEGAEEGAEEEGEEEEAEEAGDAEIALEPGDEISLGRSVDDVLTAMLIDFESQALKSAQMASNIGDEFQVVAADELTVEWYKAPLSKLLFEQVEEEVIEAEEQVADITVQLDMEAFTADVARLVMNYQSLLDMESLIINKAKDFLRSKYDDAHVDKFEELLDVRFGLDIEGEEEAREAPHAMGASVSAAEGGV